MAQNLEALRQAAVIYPTIAILFTLPYLAWSYRRYGSVFSLRILIVYSFILYMLCVYCLVILPLPRGDAAEPADDCAVRHLHAVLFSVRAAKDDHAFLCAVAVF